MLPRSNDCPSPYLMLRRRDVVRPQDRVHVEALVAQAAPLLDAAAATALAQDVLAGRVVLVRRPTDERCDSASVVDVATLCEHAG